ncbi:MAG: hypothetical protein R3300_18080 [Candidatus Promineifilaceae bacterium]|nr:hypothetical protein [Candidatus Promineifilaceae bacterium]
MASEAKQTERTPKERRLILLSRILVSLSITLVVVGLVLRLASGLTVTNPADPAELLPTVLAVGVTVANGVVAWLVIGHYPTHVLGWLLVLIAWASALLPAEALSQSLTGLPLQAVRVLDWFGHWVWYPLAMVPLALVPLYFPNGRLPSNRWRWAAWAATVSLLTGSFSIAVHPGPFEQIGGTSVNPIQFGISARTAEFLWSYLALPLSLMGVAGAVGALVVRYRRADRVQRAQFKWVLYVLGLGIGLMLIFGLPPLFPNVPAGLLGVLAVLSNVTVWFIGIAIPVSIGVAILRYRLYDIDLIIRRTLVYGLVTALLAAVYFASVVLLQQAFTGLTGQQSPVAIVISTLVIAALFSPLRERIQRFINRRFYRQEYDAARTLAQFGAVARQEVDLETLTGSLLQVVDQTMQPAEVTLWLAPVSSEDSSVNQ